LDEQLKCAKIHIRETNNDVVQILELAYNLRQLGSIQTRRINYLEEHIVTESSKFY